MANIYSEQLRASMVLCPHCSQPLGLEAKKYEQVAHTRCVLRSSKPVKRVRGILAEGRGTVRLNLELLR